MPTGSSCSPRPLAAMLAVIDSCQRERIPERLHQIGGELRRGIEKVVADHGLSSYFQVRGRDCNLTYLARDRAGQPSQAFRTLVLQELIDRGILAPSFVVCAAHDPAAIPSFAVGQSGLPYARADEELVPCRSEPSW